ncbi:glycoside hydrolase family 3 protein [Fodinicola acaciae]|uniref:glycoside hydrolase family 3 protein n=1 Tax=Fodinicola acaciae TaxID=2681555 RepID=UPI0013D17AA3|nr:glycoside hydrolase family 3 protein [Fodinicola acaciae]
MDSMTVAQKVGQLFVAPVGRHSPTALRLPPDQRSGAVHVDTVAATCELVERYGLGGVCYFPSRAGGDDLDTVAELTRAVQHAADVPLLVATDQEGGTVARLRVPELAVPGAMALAATGDTGAAREAARIIASALRSLGINQNYAPVADVNVDPANPVIGVRSFGSDPQAVAAYVTAQVQGYQESGVAATVKHFPGHGDTSADSHVGLPVVSHDHDRWREVDAPPFRAAIAAGVEAVMTAHLAMPALDPSGEPATMSPAILGGLLRKELGFDGIVVTDALDMAGARERHGDAEAAVRALLAGADQLLMPADLEVAVAAVIEAVESGRVSMERLDESVRRVLTLKRKLGLFDGLHYEVDSPTHPGGALRLALAGVTTVGDFQPLNGSVALVGCLGTGADALSGALGATKTVDTGSDPDAETVTAAAQAASGCDRAVVVTRSAWRWPGQKALLDAINVPFVGVAIREPYDAGLASRARSWVLSYGDDALAIEALGWVLTGHATAGGRLPVDLP